jgi:hypothetical protein
MNRPLVDKGIASAEESVAVAIGIRPAKPVSDIGEVIQGMGQIDVPVATAWKIPVQQHADDPIRQSACGVPVN